MIDTAAGDDIPRKRGLGMLQADLLVVNKIDLAPHVGADLERMRADVAAARPERPSLFTDLRDPDGAGEVVDELCRIGTLPRPDAALIERAAGGLLELGRRRGARRAHRTSPAQPALPAAPDHAALPRSGAAGHGVRLRPEPDRRRCSRTTTTWSRSTRGRVRAFT